MAVNDYYDITTYRLRAGNPMPISSQGDFVLHTFGAEERRTRVYPCTDRLPKSEDFRGQGGDLLSASFSRLNIQGGTVFQGKTITIPGYPEKAIINENELPYDPFGAN